MSGRLRLQGRCGGPSDLGLCAEEGRDAGKRVACVGVAAWDVGHDWILASASVRFFNAHETQEASGSARFSARPDDEAPHTLPHTHLLALAGRVCLS